MAASGVARTARVAVVALVAVLLSLHVVRAAAVADRGNRPALAAWLWPGHAGVLTDASLLSIATAASRGRPVPAETRSAVRHLAVVAPLSPDPFLIEGAIASTEGRDAASERLWREARSRDPRSRGARYLLAERYLRTGRVSAALGEIHALVGLQGGGLEHFIPSLVAYARSPGALPELRRFFADYPRIEASVLSILATDAANADLVMALAAAPNPDPDWRTRLVSALVAEQQYARAHALWARFNGIPARRELFNPGFASSKAPPPFNWDYPDSGDGIAEPDGRGGLEVLYYGRADALLASQLFMLSPGQYRLATHASGSGAGSLAWRLRCAGTSTELGKLPLRSGASVGHLRVPSGCDAQWLELRGTAGDTPRTADVNLSTLRLEREGQ